MNILRVMASVDPRIGGPREGLIRTSQALFALGHRTEVVSLDVPGSSWLPDFPVPVQALGPGHKRFYYSPELVPWLRDHISEYDVAIIHGLWNYSSLGAWRAFRQTETPYVVFTHGMLDPWFRKAYPRKHWLKQLYWLAAEGRVLRDAASVLFTTEEEQRLASTIYFGHEYRSRVVGYGTEDPPPAAVEQVTAFQSAVPDLGDRPFLLFMSRLHRKKGVDLLLRAFGAIAKERPGIDLVVAGPDQAALQPALKSLAEQLGIASRVHWPGMLIGDAKWGAFREAEAFVLPSHSENFGIVVAEAMACATPVIITDRVNIWREVEASGGGMICAPAEDDLRRTLTEFLSLDDQRRGLMADGARAGFLQNFEVGRAAEELERVLLEIVGCPQTVEAARARC